MSSNEAVAGSGTAVKFTLTVSERNVACPSGSFSTQAPSENELMSTNAVPLPVHELVSGNWYDKGESNAVSYTHLTLPTKA